MVRQASGTEDLLHKLLVTAQGTDGCAAADGTPMPPTLGACLVGAAEGRVRPFGAKGLEADRALRLAAEQLEFRCDPREHRVEDALVARRCLAHPVDKPAPWVVSDGEIGL